MMDLATQLSASLAAAVVAVGGVAGVTASGSGPLPDTAIVIDASEARDGTDLIDPRLQDADAEIRVPRTAKEARTNVRYLGKLGMRVVVVGRHATAAADTAGIAVVQAPDLASALTAAGR
jgi:hypothetical protein